MKEFNDGVMKKIFQIIGDAGVDAINSKINLEVEEALAIEKKRELKRATKALYEAKVEDELIIKLLNDYWGINNAQAKESLRLEKTVNHPQKILIKYLQSLGYKNSYIRELMKNNKVEEQLENKSTLWKLTSAPAKLLKALEINL